MSEPRSSIIHKFILTNPGGELDRFLMDEKIHNKADLMLRIIAEAALIGSGRDDPEYAENMSPLEDKFFQRLIFALNSPALLTGSLDDSVSIRHYMYPPRFLSQALSAVPQAVPPAVNPGHKHWTTTALHDSLPTDEITDLAP